MHTDDQRIIVTELDLERLLPVLEQDGTPAGEALEAELHRAIVVPQREVPADVVTMNSDVVYEDCSTGARRSVRVVFPREADAARGRISVLAPIGSALLGLRIGQEIDWQLPAGLRRIRVVEIRFQPEAAGASSL